MVIQQIIHCFHILDVESLEQVTEYKGRMSTRDFGNLLVNISIEYNSKLLVIENNNIGWFLYNK